MPTTTPHSPDSSESQDNSQASKVTAEYPILQLDMALNAQKVMDGLVKEFAEEVERLKNDPNVEKTVIAILPEGWIDERGLTGASEAAAGPIW